MDTSALSVAIPASEGLALPGDLILPEPCLGVVVFAHGSGSGRLSPRNQSVANVLNGAGVGTLLIDLLSEQEEVADRVSAHLRFDITLLAARLLAATDWLRRSRHVPEGTPVGYFGASTGAAAALLAASERPRDIAAIVSRGGRPDLAAGALPGIAAPTLLIVGGNDPEVLKLNEWALARLTAPATLEVVPGATHLFEEPGALDHVARLAVEWFLRYMRPPDLA